MASVKRGFTLAELMIGVAITSLVALSVLGLAVGLSNAHESNDNYHQSLQTARSAMLQVQSAIRKARLVLGQTDTELLLWTDDEDGSGTINVSELLLLRWSKDSRKLREHRIDLDGLPDYWRERYDVEADLDVFVSYPDAVSSWIRNHWYEANRVLAEDVTDFQVIGQSAVPMTRLLKVNISAGASGNEVSLRSVVKIRADVTDQVEEDDGEYELEGEW